MSEFDTVIRNGTVVTASDTFRCDVGIKDGKIAALSDNLPSGHEEIDAGGKLIMPGGVDAHVHVDQALPGGNLEWADDFASGSRSAAAGGTTTIIPFAHQEPGGSIRDAVQDFHHKAEGNAYVDYAFHTILIDPSEAVLEELPEMVEKGYASYKMFMTYKGAMISDYQFLDVLTTLRQAGGLPMVHAENNDCIEWLTKLLEKKGLTSPKFHATAHSAIGEREASHRAISLSELADIPILIVHISTAEVVDQLRWARDRGIKIYAETCPQYLFLTADDLDKEGAEGSKCVCTPPPRSVEDQEDLWKGINEGFFDVVSSDHAPFNFEGPNGKREHAEGGWFCHIPNGVPGVATRLPLLFNGGVSEGRIDLNTFVAIASTNAAKHYGIYPQKGTIAIGSDADITIWDPEREVTIKNEMLYHAVDHTPYEGFKAKGWPITTMCRGKIVCQDGQITGEPGYGQFLPERPSSPDYGPQFFEPFFE